MCVTKNPLPVSPLVKSVVSIERQSRRSGWRTSSLSPAAPEEKGGEIFEKNAMKNMDQKAIEIGISAIHPLQKMEISRFFRP